MTLADAMLRLAAWTAPRERNDWLRAMRAEYENLDAGKLRWALGCVAVSIGWRFAKDGVYVALVCAAIWFVQTDPLFFFWARAIPHDYLMIGLYPSLAYMTLICLLLGAYRPHQVVMTAIVLITVSQVLGFYGMYFEMPRMFGYRQQPLWQFLQHLTIHDARPVIGMFSDFGACLVGGLMGRWLAHKFRDREGPSSPAAG